MKEVTGRDRRTYEKREWVMTRLCLECDCRYDKHVQTWDQSGGTSWCSVCKRYCYRILRYKGS